MKPLWWITSVVSNERLSSDERALLVWFGTRPAKWVYRVPDVMIGMGWGRQKYQRTLAGLKEAGWLKTEHIHDRFGRIIETKLSILAEKNRRAENQASGKADRRVDSKASGRRAENQASIRNIKTGEDFEAAVQSITHPQFLNRGAHDA